MIKSILIFQILLALARSNPPAHIQVPLPVGVNDDPKWCDPVLGCLTITDDWYSAMRPINFLPYTREKIDTHFYLHTPDNNPLHGENQVELKADDLSTITNSNFDPNRPTKMIVHGFIDTGNKIWLFDLADAFLSYGDYNVIRIDWGGGSLPLYGQAAANCRVVGLEIGHLINTMSSVYGLNPATVHILGHSLGAHIGGYGGEQIQDLGRITGLDPAGPYFTGTNPVVHLDPTDAIFVDNIHTDADSIFLLGYGTEQPMGHLDFYPNSGHDQPKCDPVSVALDGITDEMVGTGRDLACCSHIRAITYFQESLLGASCNWLSHMCYDYDNFAAGSCGTCALDNSLCSYMGIRADEYVNKAGYFQRFYLQTDGDDPYCMEHYQISILLAKPKEAESWVMGNLRMTLHGDSGAVVTNEMITDTHERLTHGQISKILFIDRNDVGTILRMELEWNYNDNVYNPGTWCWALICNKNLFVDSVKIIPINYYPETEQEKKETLLCSMDGETTRIKDKETESFVPSVLCKTID